MREPFILLDDARPEGASAARLYRHPREVVVARRADDVLPALARIDALSAQGYDLAGYIAYEAGLAMEERLRPLADARCGADGPLVWFGAFDCWQDIAAHDVPAWLRDESGGVSAALGPMEPAMSPGSHARAFESLQEAIRQGDIYQANLTFALAGSYRGDAIALYRALRPAAAAGYGGIVFDGAHWLLSFSPELFFALRDGRILAKPMKGTRPRGATSEADARLRDDLANSPKDRAENLMIVDLIRNDLSRVAQAGSVRVDQLFAVESYPSVHQMVTSVRADLAPGKRATDVLRALFPCGSITGAPKIRAMQLIDRVESSARGPYCGAIGRIDRTGEAAFNVAIRTLRLTPGENGRGRAVLGVGAAIVADSRALDEWRESLVKGSFVRQSVRQDTPADVCAAQFDLIETMAFSPENGIALLELHLERLKASAAELGFTFDRHAVRNAIQALCFDADRPARLRLMVSRSGAHSLELSPLPDLLPVPAMCGALPLPVDPGDWRLAHKTSDRGFYEDALRVARAAGAHEALLVRDDGLVTEGSFTNLFVERDGVLLTPPARLGLLPGVLRRSLLESGRAREDELTLDDLAQGFLIGNALRGLMPARLLP